MALDLMLTADDQKILNKARDETEASIEHDVGNVEPTSSRNHDCLIHATLGEKNDKGLYFANSHQEIRKFLFAIVSSFSDEDLEENSTLAEPLRDLMNNLARANNNIKYSTYRDTLCDYEETINKTRFLEISEVYLLAILENAYILNWRRKGKNLDLAKTHVFPPNPVLREQLMAHLKDRKIDVPKPITDCDSKPIRAIHIENTEDSEGSKKGHFSRVEWSKDINDEVLVPNVDAAIKLYNHKLSAKPKKDDEPKPNDPKPKEPEQPKVIPNPVKGNKIEPAHYIEPTASSVIWTDDEKKKIYRNNINFLLLMMAQDKDAKDKYLQYLNNIPLNAIIQYRDAVNPDLFYTKMHAVAPKDVASLLIENITAYERLKSSTGRLIKEYQDLKAVVQASRDDTTVLDDPQTQAFKSHAYVRTDNKQTYLLEKTYRKLRADAPKDSVAMLHLKKADSASKPTNYHMVGLGNLKAAAQWINEDMPKINHVLKQGAQSYRLFLSQDPKHPDRYQIFKCEVDAQGEYKQHVNQVAITPAEEALWAKEIEGVFKAYSQYKKIYLYTGGFKP